MNYVAGPFRPLADQFGDPVAARLALLLVSGGHRTRRLVAGRAACVGGSEQAANFPVSVIREVNEIIRSSLPDLIRRVQHAGWRWLTPEHPEYPTSLDHVADPPLGIFVKGRLSERPAAAVVGSRRATSYGLQTARALGEAIAGAGGTVISGMARGIDSAAHEGALAVNGQTWAVWATGPDSIYPPESGKLAESIAKTGALITEYPPGTPPRRHHFLERNRIISGLSRVVVVVEAAARSGALNTARHAIDDNRDVMAVPGSIYSEQSVGPNGLIRAGAGPVTTPTDVLDVLGLRHEAEVASDDPLTDVLSTQETLSIDDLAKRLDQPVSQVVALIMEMEIGGRIERAPDGKYRRRRAVSAGAAGQPL